MPTIITTYEIVTEESAVDGEAAEQGFGDPIEDLSVEEACELLRGCEPSNSQFHPGTWYTSYGEMDFRTGKYENIDYHLKRGEWTEEQERTIFNSVTRKR